MSKAESQRYYEMSDVEALGTAESLIDFFVKAVETNERKLLLRTALRAATFLAARDRLYHDVTSDGPPAEVETTPEIDF